MNETASGFVSTAIEPIISFSFHRKKRFATRRKILPNSEQQAVALQVKITESRRVLRPKKQAPPQSVTAKRLTDLFLVEIYSN